jgi:hypothetical protein
MRNTLLGLLAGMAIAPNAIAQADPDVAHNGSWAATVRADAGGRLDSRVVITEFSGFWHGPVGHGAKGACRQRKFPITVQNSTQSELAFTVWGSAVAPNCPDLTITTRAADQNAFEGTVESVGTIRLTRRR